MLVSVSFQFIGFLLTYVLHTTHAAKHGSRAGLGITLIQYGLYLRNRAEEMIETNEFPHEEGYSASNDTITLSGDPAADAGIYWAPGWRSPPHLSPSDGVTEIPSFSNYQDAEAWGLGHNVTISDILNLPTAREVGEANEWLSFVLMAGGWFLLLSCVGGYWRVKRFGEYPAWLGSTRFNCCLMIEPPILLN